MQPDSPNSIPNGQIAVTEQPQVEQLVPSPNRKKSLPFLFILFGIGIILTAVGYYLMTPVATPIGIILSCASLIVYLNLLYFRKRKRSAVSITVSVILSGILFVVVFFVSNTLLGIISATGFGHSNKAQAILQPMVTQIQNLGGKEFCSEGDNGYTLDNTQPWNEIEYIVPNIPDLKNKIIEIFAEQGYSLTVNTDAINTLKEDNMLKGEKYDSQINYLAAQKDDTSVYVIISPFSDYINTPDASNDSTDCQAQYSSVKNTVKSDSYFVGVTVNLPSTQ